MSDSSDAFIPYGRQSITASDIQAVINVLHSPYLTQGPSVPAFEEALAQNVCAQYGVAVNSATSALHIACLALDLGVGDFLWTSPITFVASANCALFCGASVDFVDIDITTGLMSVDLLSHKLEQAELNGTLPKIVVPVHLAGSCCDMKAISLLASRYGFHVIEDASHAIGGYYRDEPVGNCRYSSITVFSFHPVKIITSGEGGLATTNNSSLALRMSELRSHGIVRDADRFENPVDGPWSYEQHALGFNYRMTDLQAALGLSQLERLSSIVAERNRLFSCYKSLLAGSKFELLVIPKYVLSSVHLAVVRMKSHDVIHHRLLFEHLRNNEIGVQLHYIPVHLHPYYRRLGFVDGQFKNAELYAQTSFSIPLFPGLTFDDQLKVVRLLTNFL